MLVKYGKHVDVANDTLPEFQKFLLGKSWLRQESSFRCVHKVGGSSQYFTRNYEHKKRRCRLSLPDGFDQYTVYFQIKFQAFGGILGLDVILERASDNTVAIAL